jgi:hypothetical protein
MPDDLADMIYSRYTPQTAADVLANWHAIGEDGRPLDIGDWGSSGG